MDWGKFAADGKVDWAQVEAAFPHVEDLKACMQDPVFHAEGDVWTHTKAVMECVLDDPWFRDASPERRTVLALTALWHDVAKPETRTVVEEDGRERIGHPHHAGRGAVRSWHELWKAGVPLDIRRQVFGLVMAHQQIFHTLSRGSLDAELARFSAGCSVRDLVTFAHADNSGRIGVRKDQERVAEELELVRYAAEEAGCLDGPWPFLSDQARVRFGRGGDVGADALFYDPQPPKGSRVVVLVGLPGMGKDTYISKEFADWAHVSLDLTREELDVKPTANQGTVAQATYEAAKVQLRKKAPFVFNSTNLTRDRRNKIIDLALAYDARVEIHALDVPEKVMRKRNADRKDAVPDKVIDRMIQKWEPPGLLEAHEVRWIGQKPVPKPAEHPKPAGPRI